MVDRELDALERRLLRGVLVRRLVIGIGAIAAGIALFALGLVTAAQSVRLLRTAIVMCIFGAIGVLAGFVTLRVGEIRDDLSVHEADPVPWKTIALASSGVAIAIALVAAWPLGIYRWAASLASPCRRVITAKDVATLAVAPFDVARVEDRASMCVLTGVEPGGDRRVVLVEIDGPRSGYRFDDRIRSFGANEDERLDDATRLLERPGEWMIAARHPKGALYVHLSSSRYDAEHARRIGAHVAARSPLVAELPDR